MNENDIGLSLDTRSVEKGVDKAVSSLDTLITALERLEKASGNYTRKSGADINSALSRIRTLSADLEEIYNQVQAAAESGTRRGPQLIAEQSKVIQSLYEARLASEVALGNEELAFWKQHGVALGGLQKAQLADAASAQKAAQAAQKSDLAGYQQMLNLKIAAERNAAAQLSKARIVSASPMNLDETRLLFGLPSRDSMKSFAAQLKAQMSSDIAQEKLRASSATPMNLDETRLLLGLPSRDSMKSFAAQLKAQMSDDLKTTKLKAAAATPMNLDETRLLLGLPSRDSMKSFAAQLKAQMSSDIAQEKLRVASATPMGIDETRLLLGFPSRESMKTFAAQLKGEMLDLQKAQAAATKAQIPLDTVAGAFTPYDAIKRQATELRKAQASLADTNKDLGNSFKKLTIDGNDVHSMARGLASSFGLLWLTWGNLLPLFAGAGISAAVKKSFDIGSEVEYQIKYMQILGDTSAATGAAIRKELQEIDKASMFSLPELAKAMVQMQQAGASAVDALEMIKPAAALATLGQTDLSSATSVLMQTMEIFGRSASDSSKIAAELFVASKSGSLTIKDLGESMKYASETSSRFGKTTEESLAILVALSKAGIKGSSGGTALVNFLRDVAGRSSTSIAALKALETASKSTIAVFEKTGAQRSAVDIFNDISEAAKKLSSQDADKLLGKIFSDRGGRAFFAMVREGTVDLKALAKSIAEASPESMFKSAQGLMDTTKGAFEILKSSLVGVMDDVFSANESAFKGFILDITAAINSPEFKTAVFGIVQSVRSIYEVISNNIGVVKTLGEAFLAWKAVSVITTVLSVLSGGIATATIAMQGMSLSTIKSAGSLSTYTAAAAVSGTAMLSNAAAARANALGLDAVGVAAARAGVATATASGGMRALAMTLGVLSGPIGWVITGLTVLSSLFLLSKDNAKTGSEGITQYLDKEGKLQIAAIDAVIAKATERDKLLRKGSSSVLTDLVLQARESASEAQGAYNKAMLEGSATATYRRSLADKASLENANLRLLEDRLAKENSELEAARKKREEEDAAAIAKRAAAAAAATRPTGAAVPETEKGAGRRSPLFEIIKREGEQAAALKETSIVTSEYDRINIELAKNLKGLEDTYAEATKQSKQLTSAKRAEIDADRVKAEELIRANAATQTQQLIAKKEYDYTIQRIDAVHKETQATIELAQARFQAAKESERQTSLKDSAYQFQQSIKYQLPIVQAAEKAKFDVQASYTEKLRQMQIESNKRVSEMMYTPDGELRPNANIAPELAAFDIAKTALNNEAVAETAKAQAKVYQEAWDQTIGQISSDFTSQMLNGTLKVKDFMVDTFAKTVLQPQLNLLMQKGFDWLLGGAGGWFSSMMGIPSFAGGGSTGNGARSGGLDGQGGYLAMLHPKETVTDHTVAGNGSSAPVYVTITNTVGDVATKSMLDQYNQATVKQIQAGIGRSMRYNGAMSRG